MLLPHLPLHEDADVPEAIALLHARARQKLGREELPQALLRLGASPILFRDAMLNLELVTADWETRRRIAAARIVPCSASAASASIWSITIDSYRDCSR